MFASLKTIGAISVFIGGYFGFPLLLNSSRESFAVDSRAKTVIRKLSTTTNSNIGKGNCEIEEISKNLEKFLLKNGKEGDLYVGILCENTNVETGSGSLSYAWTGLFPSSLLASGDELAIGKKLDIKTKTVSKDEITTTTFESKVLKAPVAGTWKEKITNEGEFPITSISVSENTNIYLISY